MTDVDRRALMIGAATGAGLLLTACDQMGSGSEKAVCDPWGVPASRKKSGFQPEFLCAVYMRMNAGDLFVKHVYIDIDPKISDTDLKILAQNAFMEIKNDNYSTVTNSKRQEYGFQNFTFNAQHKIILFIDNKSSIMKFNEFDKKTGSEPEGTTDVVQFTRYGAISFDNKKFRRMENNTFFNLDIFDLNFDHISKQDRPDSYVSYALDFWNLDEYDKDITQQKRVDPNNSDTYYIYSMNIFVLLGLTGLTSSPNPLPCPSPIPSPTPSPTPTPTPTPSSTPKPGWPIPKDGLLPVILDPDVGNNGGEP